MIMHRVKIEDPKEGYVYWWSPCEPYTCPDQIKPGKDCAVSFSGGKMYIGCIIVIFVLRFVKDLIDITTVAILKTPYSC